MLKEVIEYKKISYRLDFDKSRKKNSITNTSFYHSPLLPKKHNHVEIKIDNFKLIYNDPRRFGYFSYFKNDEDIIKSFKKYGLIADIY